MMRMRKKDLALVAFAGGLLAIEVVGLQAVAPAALRTLAGVTGMRRAHAVPREYLVVVGDRHDAFERRAQVAAWRSESCRVRAHSIRVRREAQAVRRAIEAAREASAL